MCHNPEYMADHETAAVIPAGTAAGRRAAEDLRRLLADLGAPDELLTRIVPWADLGDRGYVYVPPLPADVVQRLVQRLPPGAVS